MQTGTNGLQDRVAGLLVGLAAGDDIGGRTEIALRLARSLAALQCYDPGDVFGRYLEWHRAGSFDTGVVATCVFNLGLDGVSSNEAAAQVHEELQGQTAGCCPSHRAGVLAMSPWLSREQVQDAARVEAGLTHAHPAAAQCAAMMATECRHAIMDKPLTHDGCSTQPISPGGLASDAMRAALHFYVRARDPLATLAAAKEFAGPSNYCPVLLGALLGARHGASVFDDASLSHHPAERIAEVRDISSKLADCWQDLSASAAGAASGSA